MPEVSKAEAASNRGLFLSIALTCPLSLALVAVWAVLIAFNLIAPTYAVQLSVITQGPTRQASLRYSRHAQRAVEQWISAAQARSATDVSQLQAIAADGMKTRNWLTIAHYTITSHVMARLDRFEYLIKRRSPWRVSDISRTGEFIQVPVRPGVTVLRLSQTVGTPDRATRVRLQISGPDVRFSPADLVPICLIALLALSFGAAEQNSNAVHAYPRGMHPAIVAGQMLTLTLFACLLISYARAGLSESRLGLLVVDGAVALGIGRWLWITWSEWSSHGRLTNVRRGFVFSAALLCIGGALIAVLR